MDEQDLEAKDYAKELASLMRIVVGLLAVIAVMAVLGFDALMDIKSELGA